MTNHSQVILAMAYADLSHSFAQVRKALLLVSLALLLAVCPESMRGQSVLDGFDPNANDDVYAVVVQPDGKTLLGGRFTTLSPNGGAAVTRTYIARLDADGTLDTAFNPNANDVVNSIALQADGKILVGGAFTSIGGQMHTGIARLDATTGLADSFDPNSNGGIQSIVVQRDGKILTGGAFSTIGGQTRHRIARLDPITGLADSFNPNASDTVFSIAVQPDGKVLAGGLFQNIGGQPRFYIARLDSMTGSADSFDPHASSTVATIAVQADGHILAGGFFSSIGGQQRNAIARLDPASGLADSFNPNPNPAGVFAIALQADGKILAAGDFTTIGGQPRRRIARLDPATGLADSFDPSATGAVYSVAVQSDGKVLLGGGFSQLSPSAGPSIARNKIARVEIDGGADRTLNLNPFGGVTAIAFQADGKILIGGNFTSVLGTARNLIARLNPDGTLDLGFNPNASGSFPPFSPTVATIAVQADGKILVGGKFSNIGGQPRNHMARLDPVTGLADSFNPNPTLDGVNTIVNSILVQPDGKILVCGQFAAIGGSSRHQLARLDPTTGFADSFNPQADNSVFSMALQPDGKILIGGFFLGVGGQLRKNLARVDPVTGLPDSFSPSPNDGVFSLLVQPDGKILVGGWFSTIGGQPREGIARLDPVTGLADSFNPAPNNVVDSLAQQANGRISMAGQFTQIGGTPRFRVAQVDGTMGLADLFDPHPNNYVYSVAVQQSGKILLAGPFTAIGGQRRPALARFSASTAALQDLEVRHDAVTWTLDGSSPQFARATFEFSHDGVSYVPLGPGMASGHSWILAGLSLPIGENFYVRARGFYRSGYRTGSESIMESIRNAFIAPGAAQPLNLSTRMRVQTGDDVGIGGFIITGTDPKQVLLRAIGPSLTQFGVPNALADPVMELHGPSGFVTVLNDNWQEDPAQAALIMATGLQPTNNLESAISAVLDPGAYTAVVRGKNNITGVGLVEVYDVSQAVPSKLANISSRAFVGTANDIVIAGFILGGSAGADRIVLRGIGPSLTASGVPNALADPTLELRDNNGALVKANDNWQDDPAQSAELIRAGLAPNNQFESGIAATLAPGLYTALLAGMNNGTGIGVVEVYDRGGAIASPTPSATPTIVPTITPTPTPTPSGTVTPTPTAAPTPSPVCLRFENFDDVTTLPANDWIEINHSTTPGTTGWFQGNGAVFPAHSGAQTSYIAANFLNGTDGSSFPLRAGAGNISRPAAPPRTVPPETPPTPAPTPTPFPNSISNWLLTPTMPLQNGSTLIFYTRTVDAPQFPDRLQVRMSTNGASTNVGTTATDVGDFATLLLDINPTQTTTGYPKVWTQFTATVSGLGSPAMGRLAFRYFVVNAGFFRPNADYIGIDTVTLSCTAPTPTPVPTPSPTATSAPQP
jgi:uncharacterized delta-60 repeat protein